MREWCMPWVSGGSRRGLRWLATLLCWGALAALALPRLQTLPTRWQQPPARLVMQFEPQPGNYPPSLTPHPVVRVESSLADSNKHVNSEYKQCVDLEHRMPSLPVVYCNSKDYKTKLIKINSCAPFPSIYKLLFHNTYWQSMYSSKGIFHFYGAYMDVRDLARIGPAVRVLTVHDRIEPTIVTHCQLWFEERADPVVVRNLEYKYVWINKWGNYRDHVLQPYLMTCVLPEEVRHLVPASVSVVENACDRATNNLRVHYDRPDAAVGRKEFAVCVKGLDFLHEDFSVRLVEWIELIKIMGVDKVFFYELQVHQNVTKVLDYYKNQGTVTVTPITLPGGQPNLPGLQHMYLKKKMTHKRQMELIPYNDCLYRHMYEYRWLVLLDIDEVIVPLEDADWSSLMKRILPLSKPKPGQTPRTSYHASNLYFLDSLRQEHGWEESLPRYMHMLQHVYRTRNLSKIWFNMKAFYETEHVLALHNHIPLACVGKACSLYPLKTYHARLQHYHVDYKSDSCRDPRTSFVRDTTLWRWRDPLVSRTKTVLRTLGFLRQPQ